MYLAPLNYDMFFKKVFSETKIAKQFIEDFLNIKIKEIKLIQNRYKITDSSKSVEFDFRCLLDDNKHIIIDMQQWYKADVVPRFFTYHALNTSLQLEQIGNKIISIPGIINIENKTDINEDSTIQGDAKGKKIFNYKDIALVITIVWLGNDNLGSKENYSSYSMINEGIIKFLRNDEMWNKNSLLDIIKIKNELLLLLEDKTKNKDFIAKNKLIFAYQNNIVENITNKTLHETNEKYYRWFEFAKKTLNKTNIKEDFID